MFSSASPLSQPLSEASHSASSASPAALSSALEVESHLSWNADTGATAHMTFNRHWMRNLKPHRVPIRIANGLVVYSEGVGSVRFNPIVDGQEMPPLKFTDVLYVPALCSNLFSVLFLTLHRHFTVSIKGNTLDFIRSGKTVFQAKLEPLLLPFLWGRPFLWRNLLHYLLPPPSHWTGTSGIVASATTTSLASRSSLQAT